jgi:TRAP transporter 4TM/12TM fusion protein
VKPAIDPARLEELDPELRVRALSPGEGRVAAAMAVCLSLYALYWTQFNVTTQVYRASFLGLTLLLSCLYYPIGLGAGRAGARAAAGLVVFFAAALADYAWREGPGAWRSFDPVAAAGLAAALAGVAAFAVWRRRRRGSRGAPVAGAADVAVGLAGLVAALYLVVDYQSALHRVTNPTSAEVTLGLLLIAASFEATRRASGLALPLTGILLLLYGYLGPLLPEPFDHRGYGVARIVGQNYLTLEGIFGVPLDVAATFIVLFTIYGAVLEYSGAGRFFLDWSFAAMGRSRSAAGVGRTVTLAGFLFGTVSGSGVATTVTLGTLAWPMLKEAGYDRETAGGVLAASGIGAILSPPTLGAAAFLIAEYLRISYLDVLVMAMVPTVLYYASCFVMIAAHGRRLGTASVRQAAGASLFELTRRYGYHFTSLFLVAALMATGLSVFMAVFWSTVAAFALSFLRAETRLTSLHAAAAGAAAGVSLYLATRLPSVAELADSMLGFVATAGNCAFLGLLVTFGVALARRRAEDGRLLAALEAGGKGAVAIAATTAVAGVIVSIITLTGLGLKISGIIVELAMGVPFLTVLYAAVAVLVLGLAVPVTASYIIAAVMVVPALTQAGVSEAAAHMFIFYYAVLADVSPPTALSPCAAAAITGGSPFRTILATWKFCLPAFVVPFLFALDPRGDGILLLADWQTNLIMAALTLLAVVALALAVGDGAGARWRRAAFGAAALLLVWPTPWTRLVGGSLALAAWLGAKGAARTSLVERLRPSSRI